MLNILGTLRKHTRSKRFLLAVFRIVVLIPALVELALSSTEFTSVPRVIPAVGAILYTSFKIIHPFHWYQSKAPGAFLLFFDVTVCMVLIAIPGPIHMPFTLYTFAPVLTSALLLPHSTTMLVASITAVYYTVTYFSYPLPLALEQISSHLATYLMALGLTAMLPYIVNSVIQQRLQSSTAVREHRRLGREIHDGLCQDIYGLRWELELLCRDSNFKGMFAAKLQRLERLLEKAEKDARGSIESLCFVKEDRPFLSQVSDYLERFENDTGICCHLEAKLPEPAMDDMVKLETLYICQEALQNAAKHSNARHVIMRVHAPNGHLKVSIDDDGHGFDVNRLVEGHGLKVMQERAEALGGRVQIISIPGAGTEVQLEVRRRCYPEMTLTNQ